MGTIGAADFPADFDVNIYRERNDDLRRFADSELINHYKKFGADEGRVGNCVFGRGSFLSVIDKIRPALELGPFCDPLMIGADVEYFDVLTTEQLRERAAALGLSVESCPSIKYASPYGDLSVVDQKFDLVFSSHNIEHQPNLVKHFNDVDAILTPQGRYALIVPDKRYCFDHFIGPSTLADVLAAYVENRVMHSTTSVLEHRVLLTHNDPVRHWAQDHDGPLTKPLKTRFEDARQELEVMKGKYIDVHAWQFVPDSFSYIISALNEMELSPFVVERLYPTTFGAIEFYAILRKC